MILILSQRDIRHPKAGGAETYTHHALKALAQRHTVVHLSLASASLPAEERIDHIHYVRKGSNLLQLTWTAYRYYKEHQHEIDLVIDHVNTHQFFSFLWARTHRVFFIHQLTQEIWGYFFGKTLGRFLRFGEEFLLQRSKGPCITVSESTKRDLEFRGFRDVRIVPEGLTPIYTELPSVEKEPYLVHVGRIVPYKRVEDAIRLAAEVNRPLLIIGGGDPKYINELREYAKSVHADCQFLGRVPEEEKQKLVKQAYLQITPSIREGWGLVITEAANLGTPSLVYDVPGTAEAANYGMAGFVSARKNWEGLKDVFDSITPEEYENIRRKAFAFSLTLSWERTAAVFASEIESLLDAHKITESEGTLPI